LTEDYSKAENYKSTDDVGLDGNDENDEFDCEDENEVLMKRITVGVRMETFIFFVVNFVIATHVMLIFFDRR